MRLELTVKIVTEFIPVSDYYATLEDPTPTLLLVTASIALFLSQSCVSVKST